MSITIIQERVLSAVCVGIGELGGKQAPGGSGARVKQGEAGAGDVGEARAIGEAAAPPEGGTASAPGTASTPAKMSDPFVASESESEPPKAAISEYLVWRGQIKKTRTHHFKSNMHERVMLAYRVTMENRKVS